MPSVMMGIWQMFLDVVLFWCGKLRDYLCSRSEVEIWYDNLRKASDFHEWEQAALQLDRILELDLWRSNPASRDYDYRLINDRNAHIKAAREEANVYDLIDLLRAGLVRNLGNIGAAKLFNCSFAGTKYLIEEYVNQFAQAVRDIASLPEPGDANETVPPDYDNGDVNGGGSSGTGGGAGSASPRGNGPEATSGTPQPALMGATMSRQARLDLMHDMRQGFGRSALVLQGGAIFGLCHLGVVKALHQQRLLPRIIVGTATGAMMAALVGVHPEEDLDRVLKGDGIDLSAFAGKGKDPGSHNQRVEQSMYTRWATLQRRIRRFRREGYFLDVKVLEECIRANVGELTFEEAYNRSKRVLNITVVTAGQDGFPTLLNYVTAPNVLVWTAAVASNASSSTFYGHRQTRILCKDAQGNVIPWAPASTVSFQHWTNASYTGRNSPLQRVAELFNVNHFITSQARPYLIPFLQSDMHGPSILGRRTALTRAMAFLIRLTGLEVRHRLRQLDRLRLLSPSIRRFLVDEQVPGPSMTLVPEIKPGDFVRLLETPTQETLEFWIRRGERSVWPAVTALKVRCTIEMELDQAYLKVRKFKAKSLRRLASRAAEKGDALVRDAGAKEPERKRTERVRAQSIGDIRLPRASTSPRATKH